MHSFLPTYNHGTLHHHFHSHPSMRPSLRSIFPSLASSFPSFSSTARWYLCTFPCTLRLIANVSVADLTTVKNGHASRLSEKKACHFSQHLQMAASEQRFTVSKDKKLKSLSLICFCPIVFWDFLEGVKSQRRAYMEIFAVFALSVSRLNGLINWTEETLLI